MHPQGLPVPVDGDLAIETIAVDRMATGGAGVGRRSSGQVVFVTGAVPGDSVAVEIVESKKRFARGRTVEVLEAGPSRVPVACSHAAAGQCGGCDWLHIDGGAQRQFKVEIVADQLRRLGGIGEPMVEHSAHVGGPRTTVRCVVTDGRAGFRAAASHDAFAAASCRAAHPLVESLIVEGRFGSATEVTLRASASTGARLAMIDGTTVDAVTVPDGTVVVSAAAPGDASVTETVAGRVFRIGARSFFQASPEAAAALGEVVGAHAVELGGSGPAIDLYGGVGLLGAVAVPERLSALVEWSESSIADADHNLSDLDVEVERARVERWKPERDFELAIADPARRGLGREGVAAIGRSGADRLVLVNCDPAAAGRDAALLNEQGWSHVRTTVVDVFADTSSIEAVSAFRR